jgi:hypothetical protein
MGRCFGVVAENGANAMIQWPGRSFRNYSEERNMTPEQLDNSPFRQPNSVINGKQSEEEFVLKVRRNLEGYRKWRPWLIGFHSLMLVALISVTFMSYRLIESISVQFPAAVQQPAISLTVGIMIGAKMGFWLLVSISALKSLICGERQAELLVKYHDRLQQQPDGTAFRVEQLSQQKTVDYRSTFSIGGAGESS